jgi:Putative prokaryotic signal transducing protein
MSDLELVVVSTFGSAVEAELAKAVLNGAGIESIVRTDNAGGMYPPLGETKLLVRKEDLELATQTFADLRT